MSAPIRQISLSQIPVFLLNSCLSLFSAAWFPRHPFSLSYGAILPSSLTMLLPPALGSSPHPPVSVYGTGTRQTIAAFLGTSSGSFPTFFRSLSRHWIEKRLFLLLSSSAFTGFPFPGSSFEHASPQFCYLAVQESPPVVHRLRLSASP